MAVSNPEVGKIILDANRRYTSEEVKEMLREIEYWKKLAKAREKLYSTQLNELAKSRQSSEVEK